MPTTSGRSRTAESWCPASELSEQVAAIGPGMVWNSGKWYLYANGYHEFGAENRPEGNKLVLRVEKVF
jgi:hypothetical protein